MHKSYSYLALEKQGIEYMCDLIWENPPYTYNFKYLEIPILII